MRHVNSFAAPCLALAVTASAIIVPAAVATPAIASPFDVSTEFAAAAVAQAAPAAVPAGAPADAAGVAYTRAQLRHLKAVETRKKIIRLAKKKMRNGGQYVAGAASNMAFDCSGFVKVVYKQVTGRNLPHYSVAQWHATSNVKRQRDLQKGDILFWGPGGSQHSSIYIGKGRMIGANSPSSDIVVESIHSSYWSPRYAGAGRVIKG